MERTAYPFLAVGLSLAFVGDPLERGFWMATLDGDSPSERAFRALE